jgi:hypothetical protein
MSMLVCGLFLGTLRGPVALVKIDLMHVSLQLTIFRLNLPSSSSKLHPQQPIYLRFRHTNYQFDMPNTNYRSILISKIEK